MIGKSNRSEWTITLVVILCSAILLTALAFAIGGNPFRGRGNTVRAVFPDITGVKLHSIVKYAGANAGEVIAVRILTSEERAALPDPANTVELTLSLNRNVPPLTDGATASLASDTILADKFVLVTPGPANAPAIGNDAVLAGTAPVTIDALSADLASALAALRSLAADFPTNEIGGLLGRLPDLFDSVQALITQARGVLENADTLVGDGTRVIGNADTLITQTAGVVDRAGNLVDATHPEVERLMRDLRSASASLEQVATRAERLIRENEGPVNRATRGLERAIIDFRVTSAYAKVLAESLARRPQQVIWGPGRRPNELPSPAEILGD